PVIYAFLSCFELFLAPIHVDLRMRRRIEAAIANAVRSHSAEARAFFDDAVKYPPRSESEDPFQFLNRVDHRILGLKRTMFA
ncbi:MAG: hypothetical protein V2A58_09395, partial [Planctomycetota bacterium]